MESARLDAIMGSCSRSMPSVRSGIRAYICFVDDFCVGAKSYFPPRLEWLLAWSTCFRSEGTLANYMGYVKTACLVLDRPVKVFQHASMGRAKAAALKRLNFEKRPKKWIRREMLEKLLLWCQDNVEFARYGFLFLVSYVFLLRLPSEALPIQHGRGGEESACLTLQDNKLTLVLRRRPVLVDRRPVDMHAPCCLCSQEEYA